MRGHGFCTVGESLPVAVFRAIYTEINSALQREAIALGGTVTYLDEDEARLSEATNRSVVARPWELLEGPVRAANLMFRVRPQAFRQKPSRAFRPQSFRASISSGRSWSRPASRAVPNASRRSFRMSRGGIDASRSSTVSAGSGGNGQRCDSRISR